jgi:hypothetical protein
VPEAIVLEIQERNEFRALHTQFSPWDTATGPVRRMRPFALVAAGYVNPLTRRTHPSQRTVFCLTLLRTTTFLLLNAPEFVSHPATTCR